MTPTRAGEPTSGGVRWSRVKAARARIAAGFYDRADVREQLLDALLDELTDLDHRDAMARRGPAGFSFAVLLCDTARTMERPCR